MLNDQGRSRPTISSSHDIRLSSWRRTTTLRENVASRPLNVRPSAQPTVMIIVRRSCRPVRSPCTGQLTSVRPLTFIVDCARSSSICWPSSEAAPALMPGPLHAFVAMHPADEDDELSLLAFVGHEQSVSAESLTGPFC